MTKFWLTEGLVEEKNGLSSISLGSLHPWNQAILGQKYVGGKSFRKFRKIKLNLLLAGSHLHSIYNYSYSTYIVLSVISNLEMI